MHKDACAVTVRSQCRRVARQANAFAERVHGVSCPPLPGARARTLTGLLVPTPTRWVLRFGESAGGRRVAASGGVVVAMGLAKVGCSSELKLWEARDRLGRLVLDVSALGVILISSKRKRGYRDRRGNIRPTLAQRTPLSGSL